MTGYRQWRPSLCDDSRRRSMPAARYARQRQQHLPYRSCSQPVRTRSRQRLEVLRELVPNAEVIGLLINPRSPQGLGTNTEAEEQARDAQAAASAMRRQLILFRASSVSEIDEAFAAIVQQRAAALIVASDVFLSSRKDQLIALAARHRMPTIYPWRDAVIAGGLLSYGIDLSDSYRQVGGYIGRILKGAKPAELPVLQPTRFPLAINLRTATALGLTVPPTLLARADEVIE